METPLAKGQIPLRYLSSYLTSDGLRGLCYLWSPYVIGQTIYIFLKCINAAGRNSLPIQGIPAINYPM